MVELLVDEDRQKGRIYGVTETVVPSLSKFEAKRSIGFGETPMY